jgi:hypothetical protein
MKLFFVAVMLMSLNAFSSEALTNTKYYYGDINISSADGKIPYGKTVSLIKRIIEPDKKMITEIVLQPPRGQEAPHDIKTTLTRLESSNVFSAVDDGRTFEGTLSFEGKEWAWNKWVYDIKLKDGSKLQGEGALDESGIKTRKMFFNPSGQATLLIEDVKAITSDEYDSRHKRMMEGKK